MVLKCAWADSIFQNLHFPPGHIQKLVLACNIFIIHGYGPDDDEHEHIHQICQCLPLNEIPFPVNAVVHLIHKFHVRAVLEQESLNAEQMGLVHQAHV